MVQIQSGTTDRLSDPGRRQVLDELISAHVFHTNHDDFQIINVQPTTAKKTRELLNALPSKRQTSFPVFIDALERKVCPHVLELCTALPGPPKTLTRELNDLLSSAYKSKRFNTMRALPCFGAKGEVRVRGFSLDLVIVDRAELAKSMTERASTTTAE